MVVVNWAPSVVETFKPPSIVDKPIGLEEKYFEGHVERVTSFRDRHKNSDSGEVQRSLLSAVLGSLDNNYVGTYWNYYGYSAYTKGYSNPETIRLAYMYAQLLSSSTESNVI
jgi:hypothetical protein